MEQFKNEAEDQPRSPNQPLNALGGLGMGARLPGRGRKLDSNALVMTPGRGVSDERIEVSMLGELAGLSISNESEGGFQVPATETVKKWEDKYTLRRWVWSGLHTHTHIAHMLVYIHTISSEKVGVVWFARTRICNYSHVYTHILYTIDTHILWVGGSCVLQHTPLWYMELIIVGCTSIWSRAAVLRVVTSRLSVLSL